MEDNKSMMYIVAIIALVAVVALVVLVIGNRSTVSEKRYFGDSRYMTGGDSGDVVGRAYATGTYSNVYREESDGDDEPMCRGSGGSAYCNDRRKCTSAGWTSQCCSNFIAGETGCCCSKESTK